MSISYRILGHAGCDNAAYVKVDSGQQQVRLLFDCGEGIFADLPRAEVRALDVLFLSHLHFDHFCGFDSLLRATYCREPQELQIYGPALTIEKVHHRLLSFIWNLLDETQPGEIHVTEILPDRLRTARFLAREAFATAHPLGERPHDGLVVDHALYRADARIVDHKTPCITYTITERSSRLIDKDRLRSLGLTPGPWCSALKDQGVSGDESLEVDGRRHAVSTLREELLVTRPGMKLSYLTDLYLKPDEEADLLPLVREGDVLIAECSYLQGEADLALLHHHLSSGRIARFAREAGVRELVLIHVSDRYDEVERNALLGEVRAIFPRARFPAGW